MLQRFGVVLRERLSLATTIVQLFSQLDNSPKFGNLAVKVGVMVAATFGYGRGKNVV